MTHGSPQGSQNCRSIAVPADRRRPQEVPPAMVPDDLHYTKDHEWVRVEGDTATVGITQYAADQLGDIVFVELPDVGRTLQRSAPFGVVESVKAVSDLFAPVGGEVLATNDDLAGSPETREQRSLWRRLDGPPAHRCHGRAGGPPGRGGLRRPGRGRLNGRCRTVPIPRATASGCSRPSGSITSTNSSTTSRSRCAPLPSTSRRPSPNSCWPRDSRPSPIGT